MSGPSADDITRLLLDPQVESTERAQRLLPLVYEQLRRIARQRMAAERDDHTLQPTALVHEAYIRLIGDRELPWQNRAHFFAAAAEAIRRILVDHARSRGRIKRGGDVKRAEGLIDLAAAENFDEILALDEAFQRLESESPEAAQVVRLRFYAGLAVDDVAAALEISPRQVDRYWAFARAWLYRSLRDGPA
ncbi:MAG: sigma-70 family RNA polymerase sigma factor [Phycisphaerales bacterium]|nr:sigma-70 family RNA polymerase sigma factor [Phycisphaerales bacterium]